MAMDQFLAEYYGTDAAVKTAAAVQEDVEKQASIELFMKLATAENIDLSTMKPEQVNELYDTWIKGASAPATTAADAAPAVEKTAEEKEKEKEEEEHKKEEAKKELEEKKAQSEKVAEADFLGRVMAHAYCQEMRKIAEAAEQPADGAPAAEAPDADPTKVAGWEETFGKKGIHKVPGMVSKGLEHVREHAGKAKKSVEHAAGAVGLGAGLAGQKAKYHAGEAAKAVGEAAKKHPKATHGAAAAAGAGAGAVAAHEAHKHGSAIDSLAAEQAVHMAHANGWDAEETGRKIAAALELSLFQPSEKTAGVTDVDTAVGIRALEMLETVGYPVTWTE